MYIGLDLLGQNLLELMMKFGQGFVRNCVWI